MRKKKGSRVCPWQWPCFILTNHITHTHLFLLEAFVFYVSFPQLDLLGADVWYSRRGLPSPSQGHHAHQVPVAQFFRHFLSVLRIRDVFSGFRFLPIPDLGFRIQKQQQKRRMKKNSCQTFFCSQKLHKIVNYFTFEILKTNIWANFQRVIELFTQINCH